MSLGKTIAEARGREDITQRQLAFDLGVSREAMSKYETGARRFPEDLRPKISQDLDDPFVYLEIQLEATGNVGIPVLDGDYIDKHPASMAFLVQRETNEALDHLEKASFIKPISQQTHQEREEMKRVIRELLDAACSIINMIAVLCREYGFSMRDIYKSWFSTLTARRWRQR